MEITTRPLVERDLAEADRIFRLAFGTFIGLPDPARFAATRDYMKSRRRADPDTAFAAERAGEVVGSNFATTWGSVGFFGPLTVRPDLWGKGVARRLMEPVMDVFARRGTRHAGLFTFAQSAKHVALYQKFGFWPRFLTAIMAKPIRPPAAAPAASRFSALAEPEREATIAAVRDLGDAIFPGLDPTPEIRAVAAQGLGDTVLLRDGDRLAGLAVCHCGPGTEAGEGACYVKFGAARPGPGAADAFERLLDACEALGAERGLATLEAGLNTARHEAYRAMIARGFRTVIQGVAMHRPDEPGYSRPGIYAIDDWR